MASSEPDRGASPPGLADVDRSRERAEVEAELRELLGRIYNLEPARVASFEAGSPLFGDGLGLDSLDSMALAVSIEEHFGVTLQNDATTRKAFGSIGSLARHIAALRAGRPPS